MTLAIAVRQPSSIIQQPEISCSADMNEIEFTHLEKAIKKLFMLSIDDNDHKQEIPHISCLRKKNPCNATFSSPQKILERT